MGVCGRTVLFVLPLVALVVALGCSGSSTGNRGALSPASSSTNSSPAPTLDPGSNGLPPRYCVVDLPRSWNAAFSKGRIELGEDQRFSPVVPAEDASRAFGSFYSPEWSGVVSVSVEGTITRIRAFAEPSRDQIIGAAFDGRWLVWSESHSLTNFNDWDIRAWDSTTDALFDVASGPDTEQVVFVLPVGWEGIAAWIQPSASGGLAVHVYSLAERTERVISEGTPVPPILFWGPNLIWGEKKEASQSEGRLEMMDMRTFERAPPPGPLATLSHFGSVAANGDLLAWTEDLHSVSIWREGDERPARFVPPGFAPGVDFIAIAGDLVTWGGADKQWAADVRSHSVTGITERLGGRMTNGRALVVAEPIGDIKRNEQSLVPALEIILVDTAELPPLPGCD